MNCTKMTNHTHTHTHTHIKPTHKPCKAFQLRRSLPTVRFIIKQIHYNRAEHALQTTETFKTRSDHTAIGKFISKDKMKTKYTEFTIIGFHFKYGCATGFT